MRVHQLLTLCVRKARRSNAAPPPHRARNPKPNQRKQRLCAESALRQPGSSFISALNLPARGPVRARGKVGRLPTSKRQRGFESVVPVAFRRVMKRSGGAGFVGPPGSDQLLLRSGAARPIVIARMERSEQSLCRPRFAPGFSAQERCRNFAQHWRNSCIPVRGRY